jgi:hypothetical protein
VGASERDEFLRAAWRVMVAERIDARRLVCSWTSAPPIPRSLPSTPTHPKGSGRVVLCRATGANITLLSSMSTATTTREVFEAYVEQVLAPSLRPGQVVV